MYTENGSIENNIKKKVIKRITIITQNKQAESITEIFI